MIGTIFEQLRMAGAVALEDPQIVLGIDADRGHAAVIGPIVVGRNLEGIGEGIAHGLAPLDPRQGAAIGRAAIGGIADRRMGAGGHTRAIQGGKICAAFLGAA